MSHKTLKNELQTIINNNTNTIEKAVAEEVLNHVSDIYEIKDFFSDLLNHGCACGMIGSLIYYQDTHAFYDTHYHQIEEIREEFENNTGCPITIKGDLKNFFAWFAFEETAYKMANELGIEV